MADQDITVIIGAKIDQLISAVDEVKNKIGEVGKHTEAFGMTLGEIGEKIAEVFAIEKVVEFVEHMGELGLQTERLAGMLGLATEDVGIFGGIAKLTGTSIDGMALSMERMYLNLQRSTRDGFNPAAQGLKVLGLNAKDLIGLPTDEYFLKVAGAVEKLQPGMNLTSALIAVGGRNFAQMIPFLQLGEEGFKKFREEVKATGDTLTDAQTHAFAQTHAQMTLLQMSVEGLGISLFTVLQPSVIAIIETMKEFVQWLNNASKEGGILRPLMEGIALVVRVTATAFVYLTGQIQQAVTMIGFFVNAAKAALSGGDLQALAEKAGKDLEAIGAKTTARLKSLWSEEADHHVEQIKKITPAMDLAAREHIELQISIMQRQIDAVKAGFDRTKALYDADVATFKLSKIQGIDATRAAAAQTYGVEVETLGRMRDLWPAHSKEWEAAETKRLQASEKMLTELNKFELDKLKEAGKQWEGILGTVQSAWNSQLRGLLQHTTTWAQAMKNIALDLVMAIISEFEKIAIVKPLIASLSDAFAPAELFANITRVITKMIGQVFSGATAFFAPMLGPAAPVAGAAVAAATEATALSYDVGAWNVPDTTMAMVHSGEMIIPGDFANALRTVMSGGGGSNMNLSISAWDAGSVRSWLAGGGAQMLAHAVAGQWNVKPTLRPRY